MLSTFTARPPAQHPDELAAFIALLLEEGATSYLEVGVRDGGTFFAVMSALPEGARGVAVEHPDGPWGKPDSLDQFRRVKEALVADGRDVALVLGRSQDPETIATVRSLGPFDAALIDGDHRLEAVEADYANYAPMAGIIGFHDIVGHGCRDGRRGHPVQVPTFWRRIRGDARHREIVAAGSRMGIGVLWP